MPKSVPEYKQFGSKFVYLTENGKICPNSCNYISFKSSFRLKTSCQISSNSAVLNPLCPYYLPSLFLLPGLFLVLNLGPFKQFEPHCQAILACECYNSAIELHLFSKRRISAFIYWLLHTIGQRTAALGTKGYVRILWYSFIDFRNMTR